MLPSPLPNRTLSPSTLPYPSSHLIPSSYLHFPPLPDRTLSLPSHHLPYATLPSSTPQLPYTTLASSSLLHSLSLPPPTFPYPITLPYSSLHSHTLPSHLLSYPIIPSPPLSFSPHYRNLRSHLVPSTLSLPFPFLPSPVPLPSPHLTLRERPFKSGPRVRKSQRPKRLGTLIFKGRNGLVPNVFWRGELG